MVRLFHLIWDVLCLIGRYLAIIPAVLAAEFLQWLGFRVIAPGGELQGETRLYDHLEDHELAVVVQNALTDPDNVWEPTEPADEWKARKIVEHMRRREAQSR